MTLRIVLLALVCTACVSIRPRVVSRKTQIENQVVGELARLERDLVLVSSVRALGADPAELSPAQREALVAMMDREFRRDDVLVLKQRQIVGEAADARLHFFGKRATAEDRARAKALVEAENLDREKLLQRIVDMNPGLSAADLPAVRQLVHELEVEASLPGTLVPDATGAWIEKADPREVQGGS